MKQINLHQKINWTKVFAISTLILAIIVYFQNCTGSQLEAVAVKVPEEITVFKTDTVIKHEVVKIEKWYKDNHNEIKLKSDVAKLYERIQLYEEEVSWMQDEFAHEDSIGKAKLYKYATELKEIDHNWEDEKYNLNIKGFISANTIKELSPTITRKEFSIETNIPKSKFQLNAGAFLGTNTELNQFIYGANVNFSGKKQHQTSINYLRIGTQNFGTIGRNFKIF